jgi:hypothetical protein
MKQKQAQDKILGEVSAFPYDVVNQRKCFGHCMRKEPAEHWNDDSGGIFAGESFSGE